MKKLFAFILALMLCLGAACADTVTVQPMHLISMENYGVGDSIMKANFDPIAAFDAQNNMTFTVKQDDLYAAEDLKALKENDKVIILGEESVVKVVEETENGFTVIAPDESVNDFYYADEEKTLLYTSEDDNPYTTVMGTYTFPLAENVTLRLWVCDAEGNPAPELQETVVAAGDVANVFVARSNPEADDFMNCLESEHVTVRVQDGKVTEITVDWGSDD